MCNLNIILMFMIFIYPEHNFDVNCQCEEEEQKRIAKKIDDGLKCTAIRFILSGMDCSGIFIGGLDLS